MGGGDDLLPIAGVVDETVNHAAGDDLLPIVAVVDETVKTCVRQGLSRKNTTTAARSFLCDLDRSLRC